jgi:predicted nucleotidyltransferase
MVSNSVEIRRLVRRFVKALRRDIWVERAVLYGSYAIGKAYEWSDIDLAVVSPDFARMNELERVQFLARHTVHFDARLAPIAYTPTQFDGAAPYQFASEIRRTGKVIYDARGKRSPSAVRPKRRTAAARAR